VVVVLDATVEKDVGLLLDDGSDTNVTANVDGSDGGDVSLCWNPASTIKNAPESTEGESSRVVDSLRWKIFDLRISKSKLVTFQLKLNAPGWVSSFALIGSVVVSRD
jgi:hypothetical protein